MTREKRECAVNVRLTRRELDRIAKLAMKIDRSLSWTFRRLIADNAHLLTAEGKRSGTT
jgi:hypothetical protein